MKNLTLIKLKPAFKDYIWGGSKLVNQYGKNCDLPKVAESWELSVHPDGESVIANGENKGMTLAQYIKENPEVLGSSRKNDELPILIKLIDAEDKLSIQVHPDNAQAQEWEKQNGKTEMWYILSADEDARIVYGVKEDISKDELKKAIEENTVESLLDSVPSKAGDVFFVDAGTIHAIGKGNVIVEIQQNSNVTYRLYDYDRRDKNGNARELHIEKGIAAANTNKLKRRQIPLCSDGTRLLGSCEYFAVKELPVNGEVTLECTERSYQALIGIEGDICIVADGICQPFAVAETIFVPAGFGEYTIKGTGKVLIVENPPSYSVGVDLGGTNIVAAVVDENGVVYGRSKCKTNAPRKYQAIFDDIISCVREAVIKSGLLWQDIDNVGIGCPGSIDKAKGTIDFSNNLDFYDVPIVAYMEEKLGKKVFVENDANSAAWGEFVAGAGKKTRNMILVTLGTGVGSGLIIDGHLFRGAYGTGAELGHMVIIADGVECTCGRRGCLEAYASATALIRQTKEKLAQNPDSKIWDAIGGNIDAVEGRTVFEVQDDVAKQVIDDYTGYLAEGVVSIANMFQPEIICLGGGVSGAGEVLINPINRAIEQKAFARFGANFTKVETASLGNDAGLIGAGLLWMDETK